MSTFPLLKTGAVAQYPLQRQLNYSTQVLRFADGSEQRFSDYGSPLRQWTIQLSLLDETEVNNLVMFWRTQNGASGNFSFTDPLDGTVCPSCSFVGDDMRIALKEEGQGEVSVTIRENRS
jgi:hypothetical protein